MSGYRSEIQASAGPARRGRVGGGALLLVRVRLSDGPGVADSLTGQPAAKPDAFTDLDPRDARERAFRLLACAEHAEQQTIAADYYLRPPSSDVTASLGAPRWRPRSAVNSVGASVPSWRGRRFPQVLQGEKRGPTP